MVTTPVAIGAPLGAQFVGCTIYPQSDKNGNGSQPFQAAAKIYDPLYYNLRLSLARRPRDVIFEAVNDYSTEARADEHSVSADKTGPTASTGSFVPGYYGSWTFCLPIAIHGKTQTRSVRLRLIERLQGTIIEETRVKNHPESHIMGLDSFHTPEDFRLEILARAIEGFVRLTQIGLDQGDFAGRSVVLVPKDNVDPLNPATDTFGGLCLPRIVLIDYNHAKIRPLGSSSSPLPLLENPVLLSLRNGIHGAFPGWAPRQWVDERVERDWLLHRFYEDGQSQFYLSLGERHLKALGLHPNQNEQQPVTGPSAMKTPASHSIGSIDNSTGSSEKQTPKCCVCSGSVNTDSDWKAPEPLYLPMGIGPGVILPYRYISLTPGHPTMKEIMAQVGADAKAAAKAEKAAGGPTQVAAQPTVWESPRPGDGKQLESDSLLYIQSIRLSITSSKSLRILPTLFVLVMTETKILG